MYIDSKFHSISLKQIIQNLLCRADDQAENETT